MTRGPSCPWCLKVTSVVRLPRQVGKDHAYLCEDCNVTFSGSEEEFHVSRHQREFVAAVKAQTAEPIPEQQELTTDA